MAPKSKAEAVKTAREKARACMEEINSCAWCTMRALQETFGLEDEKMLKAAGAITGGIGGMADACGSMISVAMMLGAVTGAGRYEGDNTIDKLHYSMDLARDFYNWFKAQKGCTNCNMILSANLGDKKFDFTDREQIIAAYEAGALDKCKDIVADNAAKAAAMLWDELHKKQAGHKA